MPKIVKRLTDKEVEKAKAKKKDYKLYDGEGLCLLIRKSGTKVWQYPYKFDGKRKVYTIGQYQKGRAGCVGLKEARDAKYEIKSLLDQGIDPNVNKKIERFGSDDDHARSFETLGREWHSKGTWVPKHAGNILRSLERDVFAHIGEKHIDKVSTQDILVVLDKIEERDALDVAQRTCQRCEAIFDYAIHRGICENNPASGRAKYLKKRKTVHRPHLKADQLPEFLIKLDAYHGRDYIKIAMQLLVLTFVRPSELRNARWDEIDIEAAVWKIPAEKMKMKRDHVVPLSHQALALLAELKEITGQGDLLFPSVKNNGDPISDVTLTKVLRVMGYVDERKIVPHGFRHTASTILNEHGFNADHIERQLAHVDKNKVRGVYNHAEYLYDRCKLMQWWADYLDNMAEGGTVIAGDFVNGKRA